MIRIVIASALLVIFVIVALGNGRAAFASWRGHGPPQSWVPLVGGASGVAGLLLLPHALPWLLVLSPLVLDWGCVPGLLHAALCNRRR